MKKTKLSPNKNIIYLFLAVILISLVLIIFIQKQNRNNSPQSQKIPNSQDCLSDDCLLVNNLNYPVGNLSKDVQTALVDAITDEYKAYSVYDAVIKKLGSARPFSMIIRAEEQHISMLKSLFDKYGLTVPENTWLKKITLPSTLQQACQTGVDAEIANAALYRDKLLPVVTNYSDITQVFQNLMNASQEKHLPAFEKCN